jgi:PKD repeat protein
MRKQIAIAMVAIMTVSVLAMMPVMSGSGENMTNTPNVSKTKDNMVGAAADFQSGAPTSGRWIGTTSQGKAVSFIVVDTLVYSFNILFDFSCTSGIGGRGTLKLSLPIDIVENAFQYEDESKVIYGEFTSPNFATGTFRNTLTQPSGDTCDTGTITWSARRVNDPPVAKFAFSPSKPFVNQLITFDASSSSDRYGHIASYQWDFGDGNIGTRKRVEHSYSSAGNYDVILTITDNDGATDTTLKTITVYPQTTGDININEIIYNPSGTDIDHEWLELYNNDTTDIDITDWRFYEAGINHSLTLIQGSMVIPAEGYAIIADNATTFLDVEDGCNCTVIDSAFSLNNSGEYIALKNATLGIIDEVAYNASWGADGNNRTLELNATGGWEESRVDGGTPCQQNSVLAAEKTWDIDYSGEWEGTCKIID